MLAATVDASVSELVAGTTFEQFCESVSELQQVKITAFRSKEEKLAFWINTANLLAVHAALARPNKSSVNTNSVSPSPSASSLSSPTSSSSGYNPEVDLFASQALPTVRTATISATAAAASSAPASLASEGDVLAKLPLWDLKYEIGGLLFSYADIVFNILRANLPMPPLLATRFATAPLGTRFAANDPRAQFVIDHKDPRVAFSTTLATVSSPAVFVFSPLNVYEELDACLRNYLLHNIVFLDSSNKVILPLLLHQQWFGADFGSSPMQVWKALESFAPTSSQHQRMLLKSYLPDVELDDADPDSAESTPAQSRSATVSVVGSPVSAITFPAVQIDAVDFAPYNWSRKHPSKLFFTTLAEEIVEDADNE